MTATHPFVGEETPVSTDDVPARTVTHDELADALRDAATLLRSVADAAAAGRLPDGALLRTTAASLTEIADRPAA